MTREQILLCIKAENHRWDCPDDANCSTSLKCRDCAEKLFAEYEQKIKEKGRAEAIDAFVEWIGKRMVDVNIESMERATLYRDILTKGRELKEQKND